VGEIVPVEIFDKDEYSLIGEAVWRWMYRISWQ
jgi:hypothetical protein